MNTPIFEPMFKVADALYLCAVDVTDLVAWAQAPRYEEWPQQNRLPDGKLRPAMLPIEHHLAPKAAACAVARSVLGFLRDRWGVTSPHVMQGSMLFSVVMPGHEIERHADGQDIGWVCRVHVPILTNTRAEFAIGDERLHLGPPGHAFAVNAQAPHEVANRGDTPRLHLMFDAWRG